MFSRTRGTKRIFYNVASRLPHLPLHVITDDEVVIYCQCLETILQNGAVSLETSKHGSAFICTKNGAWFHNLVIFENNQQIRDGFKCEI